MSIPVYDKASEETMHAFMAASERAADLARKMVEVGKTLGAGAMLAYIDVREASNAEIQRLWKELRKFRIA